MRIPRGVLCIVAIAMFGLYSGEMTLDLFTARMTLDVHGVVTSLQLGDGSRWPGSDQPVVALETDDGTLLPESVKLAGDVLSVSFAGGSTAEFGVARDRGFAVFRLTKFLPRRPVRRFRLFRLEAPEGALRNEALNAAHGDKWVAAVMAAEPNVHAFSKYSGSSPPRMMLDVETVSQHGLQPAAFGVLVAPRAEFLDVIERFEKAVGIPSPRLAGVWNKKSPWIKQSYLFLTDFYESQFDDALTLARRGGFGMILLNQWSWSSGTGHYEINRDHFPDGLDGLKRTVARFKKAGFKVGLHFLAASVLPPDPYLTPVPDPRLVKDLATTLDTEVDAKSDFLSTPTAPTDFPAEDGGYQGAGTVLQVGNELIWYAERSLTAPFGFLKCRRGYLGTKVAPHRSGEKISHLMRSFGYHMYDMDTSLLDEVATNFAKVANACDIDMIHFDGSERLQGDHWYYNARPHKAFYEKLEKKDILIQASSFSNYSWHLVARHGIADGHGDLKGSLDERSPSFDSFGRYGMPLDIGWYYGFDPNATLDEYEYILGATLGYDSSMSFEDSTDAAARHPLTPGILDLIARYEKLRLSGRVPNEMKAHLRIDPALGGQKTPEERARLADYRREYRLLGVRGHELFQRVVYDTWHEVDSLDARTQTWAVRIKEGPARVGIQIHVRAGPWLSPGPGYHSADALVLESFDDLAPYTAAPKNRRDVRVIKSSEAGNVSPGVTQQLELSEQQPKEGTRYAVYRAQSTLPDQSGWSVIGKKFNPPLDLSWHRGIGFWLLGDGKGGSLRLQLRDNREATAYYVVANDFIGWRYHQIPRPTKDPIDYTKVCALMFYYEGLPGKTEVACGIDEVKALRVLDTPAISDPWVELGGKRLTWKGTLTQGQYLVVWPGEPIMHFGLPLQKPEQSLYDAEDSSLPAGDYVAKFGSVDGVGLQVRVRVTSQPPERHSIPE